MKNFYLGLLLLANIAHSEDFQLQQLDIPPIEIPAPEKIAVALPTFPVESETAYVYDLTDNEPVYSKNAASIRSIASITKMMTAYVVVSEQLNPDEVITISPEDIKFAARYRRTNLRAGMRFTRERLLNLALMSSENVAAIALGRTTFPGGVPEFVVRMNQMATELKMDHTHYVDPIGIGADNESTAEDLVKLITVAIEDDTIRQFSTTKWKQIELPTRNSKGKSIEYRSTNALVGFSDWDILLQKTGTTDAAGHCVIMVVMLEGHKYAIVELDAPNSQDRVMDAIKLRHWVEEGRELQREELAALSPYQKVVRKVKNAIVHLVPHKHHRHHRLNA